MIKEFELAGGGLITINFAQVCTVSPATDGTARVELPVGPQYTRYLKVSYGEFCAMLSEALSGEKPAAAKRHEWGRWRSSHDHKELIGLDADGIEEHRFVINDDDPAAVMRFSHTLNHKDASEFEAALMFVSGALRNGEDLNGAHLYHPAK